jgi:hypothetical protein
MTHAAAGIVRQLILKKEKKGRVLNITQLHPPTLFPISVRQGTEIAIDMTDLN